MTHGYNYSGYASVERMSESDCKMKVRWFYKDYSSILILIQLLLRHVLYVFQYV